MSWLADIVYLNGYGQYVWPSYALVFLTLFAIWIISHRRSKTNARELAKLEQLMAETNPQKRRKQSA